MKKNGFTLVEVLAVIALIGIFLLVTIPTVDAVLNRQKERMYKLHIENVTDALKQWGNMNIGLLPETDGESIKVSLNDLKIEGLVEDDLANPKTEKCYDNDNMFTIIKKYETYIYVVDELVDGDEADCAIE